MVKAIVKIGTLRFEKGDFGKGEVIDVTEEEALRLHEDIVVMTEEQVKAYNEAIATPAKPEESAPEVPAAKTDFGAPAEEVIAEAVTHESETSPIVKQAAEESASKKRRKTA